MSATHLADLGSTGATFPTDTHPVSPRTCSLVPSDAPEKISLDVLLKGPVIEGNNVTLKCHADGNPQPSRFYFHLKVSQTPTGICCRGKSSFRIQPVSHRWNTVPATSFCQLLKCLFEIVTRGGQKAIIKTRCALLVLFDGNLCLSVLFKSIMSVMISQLMWLLLCYKRNKVDIPVVLRLPSVAALSVFD